MKKVLFLLFIVIYLFGNENESLFWNEVKDTNDIQLLKLYKTKYPNGIFESLADLKIKRLKKVNKPELSKDGIPVWLKGKLPTYKYYGVGKANKHFKGKYYQENLATSRARRELQEKLDNSTMKQEEMYEYIKLIKMEKYINKSERIYILLYIDEDEV